MSWIDLPKKYTNLSWATSDEWRFTPLSEPLLSTEIRRLAFARSLYDTDAVSFQPCPHPDEENQDRYEIHDWNLPNGVWSFRGLFDGHAGPETAIHTAACLPNYVKERLSNAISRNANLTVADISGVLSSAIESFDHDIVKPLLDVFPDPVTLVKLSDDQIQESIAKAPISKTITLCSRGTTALVALTDPDKNNLWIASLGDCVGVLGTKRPDGTWSSKVVSTAHNGENLKEATRVASEHQGEPEVMLHDRVLGSIAVTRAIGDFPYKLPAPYTTRIFANAARDHRLRTKMQMYSPRNLSPPYLSSVPDVQHIDLKALQPQPTFLILASDGLADLSNDRLKVEEVLSKQWTEVVGNGFERTDENLALQLLRSGLGGEDTERVSALLTVEMEERWMDDTTILVQKLIT